MKVKRHVATVCFYAAAVLQLTSCENQDVNPTTDKTSVTESFQKIETSYQVGNEKIENQYFGSKLETQAPPEYISTIMERVNREVSAGRSKSRFQMAASVYDGYDVGIIPAGFVGTDCPSWSEKIKIYMDCEDKRPATSMSGDPAGTAWWSTSWSIDGNKNLWMVFCRVDGRLFGNDMRPGPGIYEYALLKLGYQSISNASLLVRNFDNEDNNNQNTYAGDISPNISNDNTTLSFHYFWTTGSGVPDTGGLSWPDFGFSYGVFGRGGSGTLGGAKTSVDDEDSSNANWMTRNGTAVAGSTYTGPIVGGSNTILYTARVK